MNWIREAFYPLYEYCTCYLPVKWSINQRGRGARFYICPCHFLFYGFPKFSYIFKFEKGIYWLYSISIRHISFFFVKLLKSYFFVNTFSSTLIIFATSLNIAHNYNMHSTLNARIIAHDLITPSSFMLSFIYIYM